jgi:LysR family hydrogen peroxide-inducible transcriptional activator
MNFGPHPFTLRQLQYALAVAENLSFRKAAERCAVSQPSLSAQIAQLETALGARLFERDRRRVLVTPAGAALLTRVRALLLAADDLVEAARRASEPLSGTLRLGVIPTVAPYLLPRAAPLLRRRFPKLRVAWREDKTAELHASLDAGNLDGMLAAQTTELQGLQREVVGSDPFVLATSHDHPLAQGKKPIDLGALQGEDVLLLDEGHCLRDQALSFCNRARAHELEFRATSLTTLSQMVAGGAGVTLLPSLASATEGRRAGLSLRPFRDPVPSRTLALFFRKGSPLGESLQRVAGVIAEGFSALAGAGGLVAGR